MINHLHPQPGDKGDRDLAWIHLFEDLSKGFMAYALNRKLSSFTVSERLKVLELRKLIDELKREYEGGDR